MNLRRTTAVLGAARIATPGGSQTLSKQVARFTEGAYPALIERGVGSHVWDVDGNEYIDFICGLGATPLGHGHPLVMAGVRAQLDQGVLFSLPSPVEIYTANQLIGGFAPWADQARFVKTGSEACAAAVRIARMATGRETVIVVGYHGWHDWVMVTAPEHPGIPECFAEVVQRLPYNDPVGIESIMRDEPVAAVIMEPELLEAPAPGYLSRVRALCDRAGSLLISDEMVTGFRWHRMGAMLGMHGVTPDLAVFGKALANGFPLAAIVGPERIMRHAEVISGTFGGELVSLAAARAAMEVYAEGVAIPLQWTQGRWLLDLFDEVGVPWIGQPVHPKVTFEGEDMALWLQETAKRGVLFHPGGFNIPGLYLTDKDRTHVAAAIRGAKDAMDNGVKRQGQLPRSGAFTRNT